MIEHTIPLKFFGKDGRPTESNEFTIAYQEACKVMDGFYRKWCMDVSELELRLMWQHSASFGLDTVCDFMLFERPRADKTKSKPKRKKKK